MNIYANVGLVLLAQYCICFAGGYGLAWSVRKKTKMRYVQAIAIGCLIGLINSALNVAMLWMK